MEEIDSDKYLAIIQETICFKKITIEDVYNHLNGNTSKDIVVVDFDNNIIKILDKYFPLFKLSSNRRLKLKNKIALNKELWEKVCTLSSKNNLLGFEKHLCLIIYFAMSTKLNNKGSVSKELKGLVELKKLLHQTYTKKTHDNIDFEDSKYFINHLKIELIDENGEKTNVNIPNEFYLSNFFVEAFVKTIDDLKIDENTLQKQSTNQLFTQNFFNFLDTETLCSTKNHKSEQRILDVFIEIYLLSWKKFEKDSKSSEYHKWCQGTVRKWLKPQ